MRHAVAMRYALSIASIFAGMAISASFAQVHTDKGSNLYRVEEGWAKLPEGRKWGAAVGVDIDRDGKSVWVLDRCGTPDDCSGSNFAPIQKFDASGRLVASFGSGMFNYPHGLFVDRDDNVWVTDGRGRTAEDTRL